MKQLIILFLIGLLNFSLAISDDDLTINVSAYVDTYIATDNDNQPKPWDTTALGIAGTKNRQFSVVDNLKDEFALNIAQISANINYKDFVRSTITFQTGTLPEQSHGLYAPNIQEAFIGMQLVKNIWLDAGYFLTHIGGEKLLPKDNWLSSQSMVTYFEPFYQAGAKISYQTDQFTAGLHILNGNGIFEDNNDNKSIGTYVSYTTGEVFTLSYAGIYGNETAGKPKNSQMHIFHNVSIEISPSENLGLKAQVDFATLEDGTIRDSDTIDGAFTGFSFQARYRIIKRLSMTVRFSYFDNDDAIYSQGFSGMGLTGGIEYKPSENSYIRLEGRILKFNDGEKDNYPGRVFIESGKDINGNIVMSNSRMELLLNFGVWID